MQEQDSLPCSLLASLFTLNSSQLSSITFIKLKIQLFPHMKPSYPLPPSLPHKHDKPQHLSWKKSKIHHISGYVWNLDILKHEEHSGIEHNEVNTTEGNEIEFPFYCLGIL